MDWATLKEQYDRDGYLVFPRVLDPDTVRLADEHVRWLMQKNPDVRPEHLHHWLMWDDPFWLRLVRDDRLLDMVEPLIGPDIALFASHYICKPGGDGLPVHWHQDGTYWPLAPMDVITAWLAVDDTTTENGCMRVIPGSHKCGKILDHRLNKETEAVLEMEVAGGVDESRAVDVEIPAGGISLHHPLLVHGSNPNRSPRRRCGLTIRYIPATTRVTRDDWKTFMLRGNPVPGINDYAPFPEFRPADHFAGDLLAAAMR